jgi:D-alanyl-D-alanine carboxypeptidase (penicillin-binding protein 5/6)
MRSLRPVPARAVTLAAIICLFGSGAASGQPALAAAPSSAAASAAAVHSGTASAAAAAGPTGVRARGADLTDLSTGRRLWSRGRDTRRPIASITKVMTALVVLRAGGLARKIRITPAVVRYVSRHDASSAGLRAGDVLTARQLLEGLLLPSGCDAAFALATAYGPGWKAFVRKMNALAKHLGMTATRFANFDGLPWPTEHSTYSTPRDLVLLGEAAMRLPAFRDIVRRRSYFIEATARHHSYRWKTTNLLLGHYRGLIGIKTGQTRAAGYCLLFEARRGARTLIGVVLDSSTTNPNARFTDAARLLNWGFRRTGQRAGHGSLRRATAQLTGGI